MLRVALMLVCAVLMSGFAAEPQQMRRSAVMPDRAAAWERWLAQGIHSYDLAVAVDVRGQECFQRVRVRRDAAVQLSDTCNVAWLGTLSVPQIFEVAERLADLPPLRCQPSVLDCVCQRVFSVRDIVFDERTSLPALVYTHSDVTYNWGHEHLWQQLLRTRTAPVCAPEPRVLRIRVLRFTPSVDG